MYQRPGGVYIFTSFTLQANFSEQKLNEIVDYTYSHTISMAWQRGRHIDTRYLLFIDIRALRKLGRNDFLAPQIIILYTLTVCSQHASVHHIEVLFTKA